VNNLQRTELNQILVFTLDEPRYAINLAAVERVVRAVAITPLPKVPQVVQGVINVQGQIVPVVDIRKRLNLPTRELRPDDQFILARSSRRRVALVVDAVVGVRALAEQDLVSAAQALPYAAYIHSVARVDDRLILICNLDQFLSPMEERMLAETSSEIPE